MYNKTKLLPLGKCKVKIRNPRNNKLYRLEFQVVDHEERIPLLGRRTSEEIQLMKVQYENILTIDSIVIKELSTTIQESNSDDHMTLEKIITESEDISKDDGCLEGEYNIEIDNSMPPVKLPKCRVPVATMTPLKEELENSQRLSFLSTNNSVTVSALVIVSHHHPFQP